MQNVRKRIFDIIQIGNRSDIISRIFDHFIVTVIFLNLAVTLMLTFDELSEIRGLLEAIELVTIIVFTVEYILRIWTAKFLYPSKNYAAAVLAFIFSFYGLIDLFTFLPYYLPVFFPAGAVAFRMFRVIRIFRLFKINAQYDAFNVIIEVINDKKNQLISSMVLILIFLLASSLCMYSFEHEAQPEAFRNAFSGMWWAVSALLTVGYGDIYPITFWGQFFAIVIAFLGVGIVAIPTGIISAGFIEKYTAIKTYRGTEKDLSFVISEVDEEHPWAKKKVAEIVFPPGLLLAMIIRHGDTVTPKGSTMLYPGDKLVIGAKNYKEDKDISLKEITVDENNTWVGRRIKELDIPKDNLILMIKRGPKTLVPVGNTIIKKNDGLIIFSYDI